jgi:hypothetical protein
MTRKIFKYRVPIAEKFVTALPKDARILRVEDVEGEFFLWAIVDPDTTERSWFWFECYKTGQPIETEVDLLHHVGNLRLFVMQELMLYVFQRTDLNRAPISNPEGDLVKSDSGFQVFLQP